MLKSVRIKAGLGDPPQPFYTNGVESQNNVIKHQIKYTSQESPQFINSMQEMVVCQRKEVERAVIGIGEYRLSERFKQYSIDQSKFFLMFEKQREKSLKKFFTAQFDDSCMQGCPEFEGTVAEEQGQGNQTLLWKSLQYHSMCPRRYGMRVLNQP